MNEGLSDCYIPAANDEAEEGVSNLMRVYRYILSDSWGQGAPLPGWKELWAKVVEPKLAAV